MVAGMLLAGVAGVAKEHADSNREAQELRQSLSEAFGAHRAAELMTVAEQFAAGEVTAEAVQEKWLTPEVRERLDAIGIEDPEAIALPYRNFRDRSLPVALVLALPGGLAGLGLVQIADKWKARAR